MNSNQKHPQFDQDLNLGASCNSAFQQTPCFLRIFFFIYTSLFIIFTFLLIQASDLLGTQGVR